MTAHLPKPGAVAGWDSQAAARKWRKCLRGVAPAAVRGDSASGSSTTEGWQPQRAQTCEHQVPKALSSCPNAAHVAHVLPGREKSDPT